MTSDEIKAAHPTDKSTNGWLQEVAYQLAKLNEKPPAPTFPKPQQQPARR